jgi:NAD-dependent protein deacetylase/lipoamidase
VYPAAAIPETVAAQGAPMVIINREPTPLDGLAAVALRGEVERLLPALLDAAPA